MPPPRNAELYAQGERLWRSVLSCGHDQYTTTVVGDFDFEGARKDFPAFCLKCEDKFPGKMVELVSAEEVPVEEW